MEELLQIVKRNLDFCETQKDYEKDFKRENQLKGMMIAYNNVIKLIGVIKK